MEVKGALQLLSLLRSVYFTPQVWASQSSALPEASHWVHEAVPETSGSVVAVFFNFFIEVQLTN